KFYEDHAYSRVFKSKQPNNTYKGGDGLENKEYNLKRQFQQATTKIYKYKQIKTKPKTKHIYSQFCLIVLVIQVEHVYILKKL
ncbi:MAG: hypothetical protein RR659_01700, partial [Bacilli bacterium]